MPTRPSGPHRIVIPLPFPIGSANVWLFPGDRAALVDCGIGTPEGLAALEEGLRAAGADGSPLDLYVTHGHVDHAGNARRLMEQRGARLLAPEAESAHLETFRRDADARNDDFAAALLAHGMPAAVVAKLRASSNEVDRHTHDLPIAAHLVDGQRVQLGDTAATAHLAPGHTPGSVVFHTESGDLLSGDTLLEHITSNAIELRDADRGRYARYLRTLEGLRRFVGCRVLPGHHEPFVLTDALLDTHLAKHHRRSLRVLEHLDAPRSAWELLPLVLPHLARGQTFLGMCEVVGHLHALELEGKAVMHHGDGVRRFGLPA